MSNEGEGKGYDITLRDLQIAQDLFNRECAMLIQTRLDLFQKETGLCMESIDIHLAHIDTMGDKVPKYALMRVVSAPAIQR